MRFLWTTNYRVDYIIKRSHEGNSIMSQLFNQNNLRPYGMKGNNALLRKTLKKSKSIWSQPVLTFDNRQICSASSCLVF